MGPFVSQVECKFTSSLEGRATLLRERQRLHSQSGYMSTDRGAKGGTMEGEMSLGGPVILWKVSQACSDWIALNPLVGHVGVAPAGVKLMALESFKQQALLSDLKKNLSPLKSLSSLGSKMIIKKESLLHWFWGDMRCYLSVYFPSPINFPWPTGVTWKIPSAASLELSTWKHNLVFLASSK